MKNISAFFKNASAFGLKRLSVLVEMSKRFWNISKDVLATYQLGSKSNISRLKKTLVEKEIIEEEGDTITLADPILSFGLNGSICKNVVAE